MRWTSCLPLLLALFVAACSSSSEQPDGAGSDGSPSASPIPTLGDPVNLGDSTPDPTGAPTEIPVPSDNPLYIALGNSLSYGSAASDPDATSFVALVHAAFTGEVDLLNLGVPGYTSSDLLIEGELDDAVGQISSRLSDDVEGNEVTALTLEIGGNDLLGLYTDLVIPGTCPSVEESLESEECVSGLNETLVNFETNLDTTLARLRSADADVPTLLMTLYNPFSGTGSAAERIGDLALEGEPGSQFETGLNDIVREIGPRYGVTLVEIFPLFEDKSSEYIAFDLIHPNDVGYAVMAGAVVVEMSDAGLPVELN
jgi:lysophospholipase L1-like esterase